MATSNSLASGSRPSYSAIANSSGGPADGDERGRASEINAASGRAAIAARSLRLAAERLAADATRVVLCRGENRRRR